MASEQLRMEAVVVDQATGPLRRIHNSLSSFKPTPGMRAMREETDKLTASVRALSSAAGVGGGIGGALGLGFGGGIVVGGTASIAVLDRLARKTLELKHITRETGIGGDDLRAFENVGRRFQVPVEQMQAGLRKFAEVHDEIRRRRGAAYGELITKQPELAEQLVNEGDTKKALGLYLSFLSKIRDAQAQKQWAGLPGLDGWERLFVDGAEKFKSTWAEVVSSLARQTPEATRAAQEYATAVDRLNTSLDNLTTKHGPTALRWLAEFADTTNSRLGLITTAAEKAWNAILNRDPKAANDAVKNLRDLAGDALLATPGGQLAKKALDAIGEHIPGPETALPRLKEERDRLEKQRAELRGRLDGLTGLPRDRVQERIERLTDQLEKLNQAIERGGATTQLQSLNGGGGFRSLIQSAGLGGGGRRVVDDRVFGMRGAYREGGGDSPPAPYAPAPGPSDGSGDRRISLGASPERLRLDRVDRRLQDIVGEATRYLPEGYSAKTISGFRPGDPRFHGRGLAQDIAIFDPQGRKLGNYQDPSSFRIYEQLAQAAKKIQTERYPELNKSFAWGGYFSGPRGKYGALDTMHFSLGEPMGGGSWARGLTSAQRRLWPGAESQGMGNVEAFKLPRPSLLDAARAAGVGPSPMKVDTSGTVDMNINLNGTAFANGFKARADMSGIVGAVTFNRGRAMPVPSNVD